MSLNEMIVNNKVLGYVCMTVIYFQMQIEATYKTKFVSSLFTSDSFSTVNSKKIWNANFL